MLDFVEILVRAGAGGDGVVSFRREKYVPLGGPDGGDAGGGGNVALLASSRVNTLLAFRYRREFTAQRGQHGRGKAQSGRRGEDLWLEVPVGTVVKRRVDGDVEFVGELTQAGQALVVAWGGRGGYGNRRFVSSTNQTPLLAEAGERGEEARLILELKLLADVGIIGRPNAGKSTLLAAVSAARPRIADYPFTTTEPVLGVVTVGWRDLVVVEIPGLIEGAHAGAGLGHDFLRHIERTRLLIHLVDGTSPTPIPDWHQVNQELVLFDRALLDKPQVVAISKIDLPEARQRVEGIQKDLGCSVFPISAATREGVAALMEQVASRLPLPAPATPPEGAAVDRRRPRREPARVVITQESGVFVVDDPRAERLVKRSALSRWEGMLQLRRELEHLGVARALERAGAQPGDKVRLGPLEMEWL